MALLLLNFADLVDDGNKNPTNYAYLDTVEQTIVCTGVDNQTIKFKWGGGAGKPTLYGGILPKVSLALPFFVALPIGYQVGAQNYDGTGTGIVIVKTSLASSDFNDWRVLSTDNAANTGGIADVPL